MIKEMYDEFQKVLSSRDVGESILEIGAVPNSHSLLTLPVFAKARYKIGINLDGGESYKMGDDVKDNNHGEIKILKANANNMDCFEDNTFDTIVCNSVIEHDRKFWLTLQEISRVGKHGALVVIASPGYDKMENIRLNHWKTRLRRKLIIVSHFLFRGVPTLHIHNWPGDYYRFSPQEYREVIFEGLEGVEVYSIIIPPRIIGVGKIKK